MKNIVSIVGARPNFVKLWPIHKQISKSMNNKFKHYIIHTGQHYDYELSEIFFKELNLPRPNYHLDVGSLTPSIQVAEMIKRLEKIFLYKTFDLVLVYGDTNSTFAGAYAAKQNNIKVAHIESGLRSWDKNMPEEINRILTDHISEFLYAPTLTAVKNLEKENLGNIIYTGDISVEIIKILKTIKSNILSKYDLSFNEYILCTIHRHENTNFKNLKILISVFKELKQKIIFPIHPRTLKVLKETTLLDELNNCKNVIITDPIGYIDFINLVANAYKIITDSGGLQKEAYLLETPCITVRNNTEWIETIDEKWNILAGMTKKNIIKSVRELSPNRNKLSNIFGNGETSKIVCNHIKTILE